MAESTGWGASTDMTPWEGVMWRTEVDPMTRSSGALVEVLDCEPEWDRLVAAHERVSRAIPRLRDRVVEPIVPLVPPALPAALRSARATSRATNRQCAPRLPASSGDRSTGGGVSTRMSDRVKRSPSPMTWVGRVMVRPARRIDSPARLSIRPGVEVASRSSRLVSSVTELSCSLGGNRGSGSGGLGSRVRLWAIDNSCTRPWPSVRLWCIFST